MSTEAKAKHEGVSVTGVREPGCLVKLTVEVTPEQAQKIYEEAFKTVNKQISLPGFRKGRAPYQMVVKKYGANIEGEWSDKLVRYAFEGGCAGEGVYPFREDSLKRPQVERLSREEGSVIHFEFETGPNVPPITAADLEIQKVESAPVDDQKVEDVIRDICVVHADWDDVEGRAVELGDYVDVDIESLDEPGKMICTDKRFEVAQGKMGQWMLDALVGAEVEQVIEAESSLDEEQAEEIKNFTATHCKITVKKIQSIRLPELTDELAKKVGVDSVDHLRTRIREDLEKSAVADARHAMIDELDEKLLEAYSFDIPRSIFDSEQEERLKELLSKAKEEGTSDEELQEREEEFKEKAAKAADRGLRLFFLMRQVANESDLKITEQEVIQEMTQMLFGSGMNSQMLQQANVDPEEMRSRVLHQMIMSRSRELLLDQVLGAE